MSVRLVFRPEASDEISEAYAWYELQRAGLGDEFLQVVGKSWTVSGRARKSTPAYIAMCGAARPGAFPMASATGWRRTALS